jgi:nicotinamidase/pyrazinamidase
VAGTWGAAFHPDLVVAGPVVRKGTAGEDGYSGFTTRDPLTGETDPTELETLLRERGVERVVVGGLATDYCVRETVLDAVDRGFSAGVLTDAIAAVNRSPGDGDRALEDLARAGAAALATG